MKIKLNPALLFILLSFILTITIAITVFALTSCQPSNKNTTPTQQSPENQTSSGNGEQAAQPEQFDQTHQANQSEQSEFKPVENTDYEGYKFRILGYDGEATGTWQIAAISEITAENETGEPINDAVYKRNKEVEELYNIEFGIVPVTYPNRGDFSTKFTKAVLAGDDTFDAAFLLGDAIPSALNKKNMAYDLNTLSSLELSNSWWDKNSVEALSINGKLTAVIGDVNFYSFAAPIAIFANKSFMQEYSIENLYQLVRDGKWTWDALYDISKQVSKDLNGDGIIDHNDQVGFATQPQALYQVIAGSGEYITPKNNEDIPAFMPETEKIAGIIGKVVPIFKDANTSIVATDISGYNNVYFDFIMPKFRDGDIMFHINQLLFSFELRGMDADFSILPLPKYDENQANYGTIVEGAWGTYTVIPITCADTEKTANILEAMGYYSQKYIRPAYYDVTVTNKLVRDEDSLEMMDIILNNRVFDLMTIYNWGDTKGMIYNIANSGKADTFVSQLEKSEPKIITAIQKTLDELEGD